MHVVALILVKKLNFKFKYQRLGTDESRNVYELLFIEKCCCEN